MEDNLILNTPLSDTKSGPKWIVNTTMLGKLPLSHFQ